MKYNIKLNLKAIIRAEQLLQKPFNDIDYTNENDMAVLLYCTVLANNNVRFTMSEFKQIVLNEGQYKAVIAEFERESKILAQFSANRDVAEDSAGKPPSNQYLSDIVGMLIMEGVNAHYVLNEMELPDLPFLIKAYDAKKKESMESQRLWTFYNILPHINAKKIKSPCDLIIFPWEAEARRKEAEEEMKKYESEFNEFISGKYNHLIN